MPELLVPGEPAPWFHAPALDGNENYAFGSVGGRWVAMLFMGTGREGRAEAARELLQQHRGLLDDVKACFFGVTIDPSDVAEGRITTDIPGIRWFLDYQTFVSRAYGAIDEQSRYLPHWLLLDPMLRVRDRAPITEGARIFAELARRVAIPTPAASVAPVLVVPDVFSNDLCARLIDLHRRGGAEESGFMREEEGVTVRRFDPAHKRRRDHVIVDQHLIDVLNSRLGRVLRPMMRRAFQFDATRIERFIVSCYDAADGGHFRAHRDNTTKGTAHRRFACTINLNSEDYEGGNLHFPEFGPQGYRPPTGGALLFSCSLLHQVEPVTQGRRYAFLPFFYDESGAAVRDQNLSSVDPVLTSASPGNPDLEVDNR